LIVHSFVINLIFNIMNRHKVGLTLGVFAGLMHLIWEVLIYTGNAQRLMDFKLGMHSLNNPFIVGAFDMTTAVLMVLLAVVGGYVVGSVFATIFNKIHR